MMVLVKCPLCGFEIFKNFKDDTICYNCGFNESIISKRASKSLRHSHNGRRWKRKCKRTERIMTFLERQEEEYVAIEEYVGWWQCVEVCRRSMAENEVKRLAKQNNKPYRIR